MTVNGVSAPGFVLAIPEKGGLAGADLAGFSAETNQVSENWTCHNYVFL